MKLDESIRAALTAQQDAATLTAIHVRSLSDKVHQLEHDIAEFEDWDKHMALNKAMRDLVEDKVDGGKEWLAKLSISVFQGSGEVPRLTK